MIWYCVMTGTVGIIGYSDDGNLSDHLVLCDDGNSRDH